MRESGLGHLGINFFRGPASESPGDREGDFVLAWSWGLCHTLDFGQNEGAGLVGRGFSQGHQGEFANELVAVVQVGSQDFQYYGIR